MSQNFNATFTKPPIYICDKLSGNVTCFGFKKSLFVQCIGTFIGTTTLEPPESSSVLELSGCSSVVVPMKVGTTGHSNEGPAE